MPAEAGQREQDSPNGSRGDATKDLDLELLERVGKKPRGLKWRTSSWYITTVVAMGVATDCLSYSIVVPVLPYRLEQLKYTNISALTSWLLFAYSIGIFLFSFPIAYFFDRYPWRREPLVVAIIVLEGALILFMLVTPFWLMVVSRFLMGAASTVVWSVGFALICENVEEKNIGRQIGFALAGVSVGTTIAPPIGGALYSKLGWHAPFIFTIALCAIDLVARLLVIEQKDLLKWEAKAKEVTQHEDHRPPTGVYQTVVSHGALDPQSDGLKAADAVRTQPLDQTASPGRTITQTPRKKLSPWSVLSALVRSPRGMSGFLMTFVYGIVLGSLDPTLTLRVQSVWGKNSEFVGLIYLASSAPTFVTGPIVGALADNFGAEWIIAPSLIMALPWLPLLILRNSLPGFVVFFALSQIFMSCALGPVGLEVAMAARSIEGMSEIHQFAAMNVAFSISTSIGAVVGGQMYGNVSSGWTAVVLFGFACSAISVPVPFFFTGRKPLSSRLQDGRIALDL
ncbi:MAG: hypothetical protein TREMPRED_005852 [Tremellales sp. Tagirdzhanova-0007]|nr:MAG: hypothetical protein TREMPRED_005852 [Tremellales sp. Tagirdzhanova-0007]